jgi:hypothetical protein
MTTLSCPATKSLSAKRAPERRLHAEHVEIGARYLNGEDPLRRPRSVSATATFENIVNRIER